jgi:hypothetical protein
VKVFALIRDKGTPDQVLGHVADAVEFTNGVAVLQWLTEPEGMEIYPSLRKLIQVRAKSGNSRLVEQL